jgi:serine protease
LADSSTLCDPVVVGQDYSIYIRLLNRGGSATSANTTVYWSPPSTLVTPDLWTKIGDTKTASVPTGRTLGVSDRLVWPSSSIPGTADYGFVAITVASDDPAPLLPKTFPDFAKFVQNSNNAGWRNFTVISTPSDQPQIIAHDEPQVLHHFPFIIPGAFDTDRIFKIITIGNLPRGSTVFLKLPISLSRLLGIRLREGQIQKDFVLIPIHAFGLMDIGEGLLPAKSRAKCELQVKVPVSTYKQVGKVDFAIAQVWEGKEVGRLTYRFGPRADLSEGNRCHCGCKHGCKFGCHDEVRHGGHDG